MGKYKGKEVYAPSMERKANLFNDQGEVVAVDVTGRAYKEPLVLFIPLDPRDPVEIIYRPRNGASPAQVSTEALLVDFQKGHYGI